MPIGDNGWAIRVFGFTREDDGFMYNPNSDNVLPSNWAASIDLLGTPGERNSNYIVV